LPRPARFHPVGRHLARNDGAAHPLGAVDRQLAVQRVAAGAVGVAFDDDAPACLGKGRLQRVEHRLGGVGEGGLADLEEDRLGQDGACAFGAVLEAHAAAGVDFGLRGLCRATPQGADQGQQQPDSPPAPGFGKTDVHGVLDDAFRPMDPGRRRVSECIAPGARSRVLRAAAG
jgi:hypothetical protein